MALVTIMGLIGSGGPETGTEVARILGADYVDRLILAEAAKRIGATVEAVADKADRPRSRRERLAEFIQALLERSALAGAGGDPHMGSGIETLIARDYPDASREPITRAQEIEDSRFIQATREVMEELAKRGNVVIIGRGANIVLKNVSGALHIGLVAPWDHRVEVVKGREGLNQKEAEKFIIDYDRARIAFFKKFFKVHPDDPVNYHMIMNTGFMNFTQVAAIIARTAADLTR